MYNEIFTGTDKAAVVEVTLAAMKRKDMLTFLRGLTYLHRHLEKLKDECYDPIKELGFECQQAGSWPEILGLLMLASMRLYDHGIGQPYFLALGGFDN